MIAITQGNITVREVVAILQTDNQMKEHVESKLRNYVETAIDDISNHTQNMRYFLRLFSTLCEIAKQFEENGLRG